MSLELYQFLSCPYCHKARVALAFSGLDCTIHTVDPANKPEAFLALWPQGSTPLLVLDDGRPLPDSTAITEYLNDRVGGKLHPRDAETRAFHRQGIEVLGSTLRALGQVVAAREEAAMVHAWHGVSDVLSDLEEAVDAGRLGAEREERMLIDASLAAVALRLREFTSLGHDDLTLEDLPLISAWCDRLLAQPQVQQALPHPFTPLFRRFIAMKGKGGHVARLVAEAG